MCIAILNTKSATLKREALNNCWKNNGDGAGILYIDNSNQLQTYKEMISFDNFYKNYITIKQKYGKRNIVLHFRISTHGKVDETNCHPFLVNDEVGFVHNGMIYDVPTSKDYSDTFMFNETILKNFTSGFERNETILDMLETFIGGSKLIFLNNNNEYSIVNEKAGHWANECWFSNSSYKQVNNYVDFGGVKKYKTPSTYSTYGYGYGSIYGGNYGMADYASPAPVSQKYNNLSPNSFCDTCDCTLEENEKVDGKCVWCKADYLDDEDSWNASFGKVDDDKCDSCMMHDGKYNREWNANLCNTCEESLGA